MLGPVDTTQYLGPIDKAHASQLEWVIVGGESGENRRLMKQEWVKEVAEDCCWANVPFFYKQDSARFPGTIASEPWKVQEWPE
jgi:protein gp37